MKKVFYVCDSYHTGAIADSIKKAFPDAVIYTDSTILSVAKDWPELTVANAILKTRSEKRSGKDEVNGKVDFFVLSAKLICDESVKPDELKKKYGNPDSKSIAVSMSFHFLDLAKKSTDFAEEKETFLDAGKLNKYFSEMN